jgi:hypothetical protein
MLASALLGAPAIAAPLAVPCEPEARSVRRPERAAMLALALAGKRTVAVGERGIVALQAWHERYR